MMPYSLRNEFPELEARFDELHQSNPAFAALVNDFYVIDEQIRFLSGEDITAQLQSLQSRRLRIKEALYHHLIS